MGHGTTVSVTLSNFFGPSLRLRPSTWIVSELTVGLNLGNDMRAVNKLSPPIAKVGCVNDQCDESFGFPVPPNDRYPFSCHTPEKTENIHLSTRRKVPGAKVYVFRSTWAMRPLVENVGYYAPYWPVRWRWEST